MKQWIADLIASPVKKTLPILSFPCVQKMGVTVKELVCDSELQAKGMKIVADSLPTAASVSLMDLSVEAEAFGSTIRMMDNEVPTVIGAIVTDEDEANALQIPEVGKARTGLYINAIKKAVGKITDRPVFAGVIGPYSLAGRLMDVSEIMICCYEEPDMVHTVVDKVTSFLINYCCAYKNVGADGIILAEPLAGLLSPSFAQEFSHFYVKKIVDSVQSDEFCLIYHNCGNNVPMMAKDIYQIGACGYHFGDAVHLEDMFSDAPSDVLIMGNVSPSAQLLRGTPVSIHQTVRDIMNSCSRFPNFLLSSGCDVPPMAPWDNIKAFFEASRAYYQN